MQISGQNVVDFDAFRKNFQYIALSFKQIKGKYKLIFILKNDLKPYEYIHIYILSNPFSLRSFIRI